MFELTPKISKSNNLESIQKVQQQEGFKPVSLPTAEPTQLFQEDQEKFKLSEKESPIQRLSISNGAYPNVNDKDEPISQFKSDSSKKMSYDYPFNPVQAFGLDTSSYLEKDKRGNLPPYKHTVQRKESANKTGMPSEVKNKMESSFNADFSNVNIHSNSSKAIEAGALAYTQGNNIHFAPGQFKPDTNSGQQLLGHELTHVVQQREGRVKPTKMLGNGMAVNDDKGLEKEADTLGKKAAQMKMADVQIQPIQAKFANVGGGVSVIQRLEDSDHDRLKNKMGKNKYGKAFAAGKLEHFAKMTDDELNQVRLQVNSDFEDELKGITRDVDLFLDREDAFEELDSKQSWGNWIASWWGHGGGGAEEDMAEFVEERTGKKVEEHLKDAIGMDVPLTKDLVEEFAGGQDRTAEESMSEEAAKEFLEGEEKDDKKEDREGFSKAWTDPKAFLMEKIELNLIEAKLPDSLKKESKYGDAELKGKMGGKVSLEGIEGEAELAMQFGKGGKKIVGSGPLGSANNNLKVGGTIEGFVGGKAEASGKAGFKRKTKEGASKLGALKANTMDITEYEGKAKGKAGAFLGASVEGSVQTIIKAGGVELGKYTGKAGITVGVGGEISGVIKWDGGTLKLAGKGKLSAGLGISWGYKLEINSAGMLAKVFNWAWSWSSWSVGGIGRMFGFR